MLDALLIVILIALSVVGVYRGCGKIVFDFFALLGTLWIASATFEPVSHTLRIVGDDRENRAAVFALLFVCIGALGLFLSHLSYESILLSLGMLDKTLGLVMGLATAIVLCHAIVKTIALATHPSAQPSLVASSTVGHEMLDFTTYHSVIDQLYDATGGHRVVSAY